MADDELETETEDVAGEAYLRARGWKPWANAKGPDALWMQHGQLEGAIRKPQAVALQLKRDVVAFVYMLEAIDDKRPGTRRLLGQLLGGFILDTLKDFWNDEAARTELATAIMERVCEGLPKIFADREFRQAVEAVRTLWHLQGKMVEEEKTKGEPN